MITLLHVSEDAAITRFEPRPANTTVWPQLTRQYVWVMSDEMAHNYFFPRNCPRVCCRFSNTRMKFLRTR